MKKLFFGIMMIVGILLISSENVSAYYELEKMEDGLTINAPWEKTCNSEKGKCSWDPFRSTKSCKRFLDC